MKIFAAAVAMALAGRAAAQDPAPGWLAYAVGACSGGRAAWAGVGGCRPCGTLRPPRAALRYRNGPRCRRCQLPACTRARTRLPSPSSAANPPSAGQRITYIEAQWTVLGIPSQGGAFYSPWFGIETSDNLNLYQPGACQATPVQGTCRGCTECPADACVATSCRLCCACVRRAGTGSPACQRISRVPAGERQGF